MVELFSLTHVALFSMHRAKQHINQWISHLPT